MTNLLAPSVMVTAFAPSGSLRASINLGNPLLAQRDPRTGEVHGVSVDLARALAERLQRPVELVLFDKAAQSVDAVRREDADIGFFAIDPARSEGLRFTAPYVLIEGSYLVPAHSPLQSNEEVDSPTSRVGVGSGSAYDLFLTRELKAAQIERFANAQEVVSALQQGLIGMAAGIRKQLATLAGADPSLRLLPGRFMVIQQAMGLPASRGEAASAFLSAFVEEMKASGFVGESLARHQADGATVAD